MLVTGEATAAEVTTCLAGVLAAETSDAVIEPYLQISGDVAELWSSNDERAGLRSAVSGTARILAKVDSRRKAALRTIARTASDLDELAWLQAEGSHVVDLQWRALVRKAELGGETRADVAALRPVTRAHQ
jgi:aminopeptidase N